MAKNQKTTSGQQPLPKSNTAVPRANAAAGKTTASVKKPSKPVEVSKPLPFSTLQFPEWLTAFKYQAIIVGLLGFLLYINTYNNEYALDDTAVILKNEYVYQGFGGIGSILTKDAFDSYYKQFKTGNQLSGGRYRPLSIVTFAIEQQFFETYTSRHDIDSVVTHVDEKGAPEKVLNHNMHIRHFFNVLWYTLAVIIFLLFLRTVVFKSSPIMALVTALIFTVHPIHTEVVANVKSRDEIMSILFMCLTFIFAFKYRERKDMKLLVFGLVSYFLAFLSKEYAITILLLLPLSLMFFERTDLKEAAVRTLPFFGVALLYVAVRFSIVGPQNPDSNSDILNNPYAFCEGNEKLATEISTSLNYLRLLLFPHPLLADYSYNSIPYKEFSDWTVLLSLVVHGGMIYLFFRFLRTIPVLSFAILFYLLHLLLVNNLIFDIGATMGERLIFHSSVGFAIALTYFLFWMAEKMRNEGAGKMALLGFMLLYVGLCSFKTVERNTNWKNNFVLFSHDLKYSPNSIIINANVASCYIDMSNVAKDSVEKRADLRMGIDLLKKTTSLHNTYVIGYFNLGLAYFKNECPDSAKMNFDIVRKYYPNYPRLSDFYYNVGVFYYSHKRYPEAIDCWKSTLQVDPQNKDALHALTVLGVIK
jgi:protein O-mannosyl-transferase